MFSNTTISTGSDAAATTSRPGRPPAPVLVASVLTILLCLFAGYGAIYFTGLEGWDASGITYVTTYEATIVLALVSAVALLRGSAHGRVGLVAWAAFMVVFTIMKLVTIQELSAIPFGVVGVVVGVLALHPATRRYAA
jgi:hypothetical protein